MSAANPPSSTPSRGRSRARSFAAVADEYDRARPSYPEAAVAWLTGGVQRGSLVLELGAGTGKLTEVLVRAGHDVVATEPLPDMVRRLRDRLPISPAVANAEQIPLPSRSADVVVCGQSFHWFDHERAMAEIARVLRPGGHLALVWNRYDTGIPWVRRFQDLIAPDFGEVDDAVEPLMQTPYFGFVEMEQFRFWASHTAASLADLARSVSYFSTLDERAQGDLLRRVDDLYAGYGRGHDGMQLPYVTHCYRAVVRHDELPPEKPVTPARLDRGHRPAGARARATTRCRPPRTPECSSSTSADRLRPDMPVVSRALPEMRQRFLKSKQSTSSRETFMTQTAPTQKYSPGSCPGPTSQIRPHSAWPPSHSRPSSSAPSTPAGCRRRWSPWSSVSRSPTAAAPSSSPACGSSPRATPSARPRSPPTAPSGCPSGG